MVFNTTCNNIRYIVAVCFIGGEPRKNQQVADKLAKCCIPCLIEIQTSMVILGTDCVCCCNSIRSHPCWWGFRLFELKSHENLLTDFLHLTISEMNKIIEVQIQKIW